MKIELKKLHPNAVIPHHATDGSAGLDLTAVDVIFTKDYIEYKTGISIKIPDGYVGLLMQRSSVSKQPNGFILRNAVGCLDSDFLGEITFRYSVPSFSTKEEFDFLQYIGIYKQRIGEGLPIINSESIFEKIYKVGDRIGQLVVVPYERVEFEEVDKLQETKRGDGGYGSTGR